MHQEEVQYGSILFVVDGGCGRSSVLVSRNLAGEQSLCVLPQCREQMEFVSLDYFMVPLSTLASSPVSPEWVFVGQCVSYY